MKILLDPGHGGGEIAKRGFLNIPNWDYCNEGRNNYYFSTLLKQELEKRRFIVGITRNNIIQDPEIPKRGQMGKGYDLMISVHSNAGGGSGVEVWDDVNPKYSNKTLGELLCKTVSKALDISNRGVKYRYNGKGGNFYGVLRNNYAKNGMILEMFFHDNLSDVNKFIKNYKKLATNIADTLAVYYKLEPKGDEKTMTEFDKEYKEAIAKGITDGTRAEDKATRKEVAVMVLRAIKHIKGETPK